MACFTLENISPCNCYMNPCPALCYFGLLKKKFTFMVVIIYPIMAPNKYVTEERVNLHSVK